MLFFLIILALTGHTEKKANDTISPSHNMNIIIPNNMNFENSFKMKLPRTNFDEKCHDKIGVKPE